MGYVTTGESYMLKGKMETTQNDKLKSKRKINFEYLFRKLFPVLNIYNENKNRRVNCQFRFALRFMSKAKNSAKSQVPTKPAGPIFANKDGNIVLQVLAKPGAKTNGITGIEEEGVGVQISSRPVDGEANSELLKYMSSVFGLKKNEISLEKGMKSRQKTLLIYRKDLTVEKLTEKLKEEMKS